MIQILCGDDGHRARCMALQGVTPSSSVGMVNGPALDKKAQKLNTLIFWGHGDSGKFCGLGPAQFSAKVLDWVKWNPTIKTVEIITCNARHGVLQSEKQPDGTATTSWVKSFTDQVKIALKKKALTVKALPMGMGATGANRWSILKYSATTNTWLYVTADGATDNEAMWPGVLAIEHSAQFKASKNYAVAGTAVKPTLTMRSFTLDFGTIGDLRKALVTLA